MTSTWMDTTLTEELERLVRRSRFSLHFNTKKRRRWLLLQFVSMPVSSVLEEAQVQRGDEPDTWQPSPAPPRESWANNYSKLLDNFEANMYLKRPR